MQYDTIRPIYYLKKWQYYETARHELSENELEQAKVFFNALKQLNENDFQILSDAYYYSEQPCLFREKSGYFHSLIPVRDEVLAQKYKVTIDSLRSKRCLAQINLRKAMQNILKQINNSFIFRVTSRLYLVEILDEGMQEKQYVLGAKHKATVFSFNEDNEGLFNELSLLGFEKIPVK